MKRLLLALCAVGLSSALASAEYKKDGLLKWTWDGSFLPPVIAGPELDFPSIKQASDAFFRARDDSGSQTIDFAALSNASEEPAAIFLFACKAGGYDAQRHLVQQDSDFVHCMTYFTNAHRRKIYATTINFQKRNRESWNMLVPMTSREVEPDACLMTFPVLLRR